MSSNTDRVKKNCIPPLMPKKQRGSQNDRRNIYNGWNVALRFAPIRISTPAGKHNRPLEAKIRNDRSTYQFCKNSPPQH
jgi:hypothetical protein